MRILVTGAAGFIGTRLSSRLRAIGHEVVDVDVEQHDIASTRLEVAAPSYVFHLAARTFIPDSWKQPDAFYRVNVQGTINVLELCRLHSSAMTFLSAYVYGQPLRLPVGEDHPLRPNNPYSHSKQIAESVCEFYNDHFGVPVTIVRPFNIYGPGQRDSFIVPKIVNQVLDPSRATIEVMDLEPRRDLLFVDDLVEGLVATIEHRGGGTFNFGSGRSHSVQDIVRTAMAVAGVEKRVLARGERRPDEILDLYADISRAKQLLNWSPRTDLTSGIAKVVEAHRVVNQLEGR